MRAAVRRLLSYHAVRRPLSVLVLALVDAAALSSGVLLAAYFMAGSERAVSALASLPVLLAVGIAVYAANDLYDRAAERRNPGALIGAVCLWAGLLTIGSVVYPQSGYSLGEILFAALIALIIDGAARFLYEQGIEWIYRRNSFRIPTLLIGEPDDRERFKTAMEGSPSRYSLVAELDLENGGANLPLLREMLDITQVRSVILAGAERLPDEKFLELLRSLRLRGVALHVVPAALTLLRNRPVLAESAGFPLLEVRYPQLDNTQRALKRLLDVAGSTAGLAALSPLLLATVAAIKLTSPGPVFFMQKRVGADEKIFLCYKFRSMYQDAERRQAELEAQNEADGAVFKIKSDPRITPIGEFIRRWSIDELPQLINVLKGEMSLVGPRPLPLRDFERMGELHKRRLAAIPGMTGYWQISGRSDLSFDDMVRLDLYYIENWSLSFDIKIILKTVGAVLRHEGAY